jgi:hypothetical protein
MSDKETKRPSLGIADAKTDIIQFLTGKNLDVYKMELSLIILLKQAPDELEVLRKNILAEPDDINKCGDVSEYLPEYMALGDEP